MYPNISERLFKDAVDFAKNYTAISEGDCEILFNARKQLITWDDSNWTKKQGLFDISIGSYDGAECCDIVGLYILFHLKNEFPDENLSLYRDDGIGATAKHGAQASRLEKRLHAVFGTFGLKITTEVNVKKTDFLDVFLDLSTGKTSPYRKPLDNPTYVHRESSHPPHILRQIPRSVQDRLSKLSSSQVEFDNAKPVYEDALKQAGYEGQLQFDQPRVPNRSRNRKMKTIWFCPPFNVAIRGNVTQMFSNIIERSFPPDHPHLSKLFNKRNLRLSYSTMPNLGNIIARHNHKVLRDFKKLSQPLRPTCNCRSKPNCPFNGQCLTESVVYQANVTVTGAVNDTKYYVGISSGSFKVRYGNHLKSFRHERYKDDTALSAYVWDAKEKGADVSIKWFAIASVPAHRPGDKFCSLCLAEKHIILRHHRKNLLMSVK